MILQTDVARCRFGIAIENAVRSVTELAVLEQRIPGAVANRYADGLDTVLPNPKIAVFKKNPQAKLWRGSNNVLKLKVWTICASSTRIFKRNCVKEETTSSSAMSATINAPSTRIPERSLLKEETTSSRCSASTINTSPTRIYDRNCRKKAASSSK